jgi:RND family efflux transporter MFP subunit
MVTRGRSALTIFKSSPLSWLLLIIPISIAVSGCEPAAAQNAIKPPDVQVSTPILESLTDAEVFTGRTQAVNNVDMRARVTGYLDKVKFREGDDVKAGDVLFKIDPRPYQATYNQAKANLAQQQSQLVYADADYRRTVSIRATGAVSQDDIDKALAARDNARAAVGSSQAAVDTAKLNLDFTDVIAPFSGRIGRRQVDPGGRVMADDTVLATLVQLDPMYAYFDVDERTLLRIREQMYEGRITEETAHKFPLTLGLANEPPDSFQHSGKIKITDNRVDASTGTLRIWGIFDNPRHDLYPNLFVRVRLGLGEPRKALFVAESALGSSQGNDFLYVVNRETKKIEQRSVKVGPRQNGLIAIEDGLKDKDWVVVNGLQRVKAELEVNPKEVAMPCVKGPASTLPVVTGKDGAAPKAP